MSIITIDIESYYDKEYSLRKMTTEEYVRDPRFQIIGVSIKVDNAPAVWYKYNLQKVLSQFDWKNSFLLAHNTKFDGFILNHHFGIVPRGYLDTLSMARGLHGVNVGASLAYLAEKYGIGEKGSEVLDALGKRQEDFTPEDLAQYGVYCCNDTELCYKLYKIFVTKFPKIELQVIDIVLRMFIEPVLRLDKTILLEHLADVKATKEQLLLDCGVDKTVLRSSAKFAELLISLGVEPLRKISKNTGKDTWAFAKTDEFMKELQDHPDARVQAVVEARLGNQSTQEEKRAERLIGIAERGLLPIPIKSYAAHTGRFGGDDKINVQNFAARGAHGGKIKKAILAPEGHVIIDCDSSQIEARVLAWVAGQDDLCRAFANGEDIYKQMASAIYGVPEEEVTKAQRFVGKMTILGCGFGMGGDRFHVQLKAQGVTIDIPECHRIVGVYREKYHKISGLWKLANSCLHSIYYVNDCNLGPIEYDAERQGFILPNDLVLGYPELEWYIDGWGRKSFQYKSKRKMTHINGPKAVENIIQALARIVITEQMVEINKKYRPVIPVHDAIAIVAKVEEADVAQAYVEACMRIRPTWAPELPLNCESGFSLNFGDDMTITDKEGYAKAVIKRDSVINPTEVIAWQKAITQYEKRIAR